MGGCKGGPGEGAGGTASGRESGQRSSPPLWSIRALLLRPPLDPLIIRLLLPQYATCDGGVNQYNSRLQCASLAAWVPGGSWHESCAATAYDAITGVLSAVCLPNSQPTYLNYSLCGSGAQVG